MRHSPRDPEPSPRRLRRGVLALFLAASAAVLAGCGGGDSQAATGRGRGGKEGGPAGPAREVRVVRAEEGRLPRTVVVTGTLAADEQAELGPKVAGRIAAIDVDLGSPVRQGQVLARLIPTDLELRVAQAENALEQARARLGLPAGGPDVTVDPDTTAGAREARALLEQAKVTRDRVRSLFDQQLVPRADLDQAEASLRVADARYQDAVEEARNRQAILGQRRSELAIARQQLSDSQLRAPFAGSVRERRASVGDYVAVGETILVLVRMHPLRLRLAIPEREAVGVRTGQPVRLTVEGDPGTYAGRIARISPAITEQSRTLQVEAEVPNLDGRLKPGAFARAEVVTEAASPAVLVPASAIVSFAGLDKVLTVAGGKAEEKRVKLGRREGDRVEIVEGLAAGEPVVVQPGNLTNGDPVRVIS